MSIKAIDIIDRLPIELAAALQCDPFFCDIPVVVAEKGNVLKEIQRLQSAITTKGGKWGVSVVVLQCIADDELPDVAFGSLKLCPAFQVIELVEQNNSKTGTGKSARKVARKIRDVIKPLALAGLCTEFIFERECIVPVTLSQENLVGYQVNCHTYEADDEPIDQVAMPQFALTDGASPLLLSCATAGAVIYYTTDDSFPAPPARVPNSTAQIYASGIAIPEAGFTIRACAFLDGLIGSQVNRANINPTEINP